MKYLFLLLVLTGCTQPKQKIQQPAPAVSNSVQTSDFDYADFGNHEEHEEPWLEPILEQSMKIYLSDLNKHRARYEEFFQEQLALHGRDTNGNIVVDWDQLSELDDQSGFYIIRKIIGEPSEERVVPEEIIIIEHGKTNYYPVPK